TSRRTVTESDSPTITRSPSACSDRYYDSPRDYGRGRRGPSRMVLVQGAHVAPRLPEAARAEGGEERRVRDEAHGRSREPAEEGRDAERKPDHRDRDETARALEDEEEWKRQRERDAHDHPRREVCHEPPQLAADLAAVRAAEDRPYDPPACEREDACGRRDQR